MSFPVCFSCYVGVSFSEMLTDKYICFFPSLSQKRNVISYVHKSRDHCLCVRGIPPWQDGRVAGMMDWCVKEVILLEVPSECCAKNTEENLALYILKVYLSELLNGGWFNLGSTLPCMLPRFGNDEFSGVLKPQVETGKWPVVSLHILLCWYTMSPMHVLKLTLPWQPIWIGLWIVDRIWFDHLQILVRLLELQDEIWATNQICLQFKMGCSPLWALEGWCQTDVLVSAIRGFIFRGGTKTQLP